MFFWAEQSKTGKHHEFYADGSRHGISEASQCRINQGRTPGLELLSTRTRIRRSEGLFLPLQGRGTLCGTLLCDFSGDPGYLPGAFGALGLGFVTALDAIVLISLADRPQ